MGRARRRSNEGRGNGECKKVGCIRGVERRLTCHQSACGESGTDDAEGVIGGQKTQGPGVYSTEFVLIINAMVFKQWYDRYFWKIPLAEYGKCRCLVLIGWLALPHVKSMICSYRGRWPPPLHWQGLLGNWRFSPDLCGESILSRVRGAANRGQELSSELEEDAESQSGPWGCENSLPHPPWQGAWTLGTASTILSRALYHAPKSSSPFLWFIEQKSLHITDVPPVPQLCKVRWDWDRIKYSKYVLC